jgi:hypothetical protein
MKKINSDSHLVPAPRGFSRREVLLSMAALAVSSFPISGLAQTTTNWPLWSIEGKNGRVYLTGETPPRATAWKDDRIENLLGDCSAFWNETNQIHRQDPQALIKRWGIDGSTPLLAKLTPADQQRLAKVATLAKVPLDSLAPFRPWVVASELESNYYEAMNLPESGTAEKILIAKAKSASVPVSSEFPANDDVIVFMGEMTQAEEIQYLQYTMDHILDGMAENERIYSLWSRGDLSGAENMVLRMKSNQPDLYKKHVIGRNKNWVPRIEAMLNDSKPALIVVGLYHVAGPDSILVQLREHGFKVRSL